MKHTMKIGMMVRSYLPMPRPSDMIYAPIDLAVQIAKGLGERGHQITLFTPLGSEVYGPNVSMESCNQRTMVHNQSEFNALLDDNDKLSHNVPGLWDSYMVSTMYKKAASGEFDILHFHHPESALATATKFTKVPTVYTLHDPINEHFRELFELFQTPNQHYISISNNQRRDAPDLPYLSTIYNGTDVDLFTFGNEAEDFLLYAGRIASYKGVKEAIQVAKESNHRLLIIGPINRGDEDYFEQYIKPQLNERILYLGRMDQNQLPTYYQKAKALLTPVQWEEPFGLTTIEAMACGTPVISLNRGAAPEIIEDGKTGFIVNSIAEMVEAVHKVDQLNRQDCRDHIKNKFAVERMVDEYERVFCELLKIEYKEVINGHPRDFLKSRLNRVRKALPVIRKK